jgi:hypothetical protein
MVEDWRDVLSVSFVEGFGDDIPEDASDDARQDAARESFDETVLEVWANARVRYSGTDFESVTLLLGFGGPNIYADVSGDVVTVRGYWGGDEWSEHGAASDDLLSWADGFIEGLAE